MFFHSDTFKYSKKLPATGGRVQFQDCLFQIYRSFRTIEILRKNKKPDNEGRRFCNNLEMGSELGVQFARKVIGLFNHQCRIGLIEKNLKNCLGWILHSRQIR